MAKRSTPVDKTPIDPLFVVPIGAEDQFVLSREHSDVEEEVILDFEGMEDSWVEFDDNGEAIDYEDGFDDNDLISLGVPEDFSVVSQVLRRGPGGQQVVDIVIESEDIEGAVKYEIQVVKA